jgi:hypothetical protein
MAYFFTSSFVIDKFYSLVFLSLISIKIKLIAKSRHKTANLNALCEDAPKGIRLPSLKIMAKMKAMAARIIKR